MTDQDPIEVVERCTVYQGYFRMDRYRLRHRKFDGSWTEVMQREVFERGHAAAVLLYDPHRDQVAMIEQFRIGAFAAGHPAWLLEAVAGIIEPGETAEALVRREAVEEAGCTIGRLERVGPVLVSPGGTSETVTIFVGEIDASTCREGYYGLAAENEDIRMRLLSAHEAFQLLDQGMLTNAVTALAVAWLARHHSTLMRQWLAPAAQPSA